MYNLFRVPLCAFIFRSLRERNVDFDVVIAELSSRTKQKKTCSTYTHTYILCWCCRVPPFVCGACVLQFRLAHFHLVFVVVLFISFRLICLNQNQPHTLMLLRYAQVCDQHYFVYIFILIFALFNFSPLFRMVLLLFCFCIQKDLWWARGKIFTKHTQSNRINVYSDGKRE